MKVESITFVNLTAKRDVARIWQPEELISSILPEDRFCGFENTIPEKIPELLVKNEENQGVTLHSCFHGFN